MPTRVSPTFSPLMLIGARAADGLAVSKARRLLPLRANAVAGVQRSSSTCSEGRQARRAGPAFRGGWPRYQERGIGRPSERRTRTARRSKPCFAAFPELLARYPEGTTSRQQKVVKMGRGGKTGGHP